LGFYVEAAAADPDDPRTAREMAGLLRILGRPGAALDVARDAARRVVETIEAGRTAGEGDRQVVMLAARLEARAGNRDRAAGLIEEALVRIPLVRLETAPHRPLRLGGRWRGRGRRSGRGRRRGGRARGRRLLPRRGRVGRGLLGDQLDLGQPLLVGLGES